MKLNSLALLTASSLFLAACSNDQTSESETATTEVAAPTTSEVEATIDLALESIDQKLSYIVGINLAGQFKRDGVNFDLAAFQMAVEDIKSETGSRLSQEVVQDYEPIHDDSITYLETTRDSKWLITGSSNNYVKRFSVGNRQYDKDFGRVCNSSVMTGTKFTAYQT